MYLNIYSIQPKMTGRALIQFNSKSYFQGSCCNNAYCPLVAFKTRARWPHFSNLGDTSIVLFMIVPYAFAQLLIICFIYF